MILLVTPADLAQDFIQNSKLILLRRERAWGKWTATPRAAPAYGKRAQRPGSDAVLRRSPCLQGGRRGGGGGGGGGRKPPQPCAFPTGRGC